MPHLVSNLVSSIGAIPGIKNTAVSRSRNTSRPVSRTASRTASRNTSPHAVPSSSSSSSPATPATPHPHSHPHEDHTLIADLTEAFKKHNLLSLPFGRAHKDHAHHKDHHHKDHAHGHHHLHSPLHHHLEASDIAPATIDWTLESPPIVFHGSPDDSAGALISGQLALKVRDSALRVDSFSASLHLVVTHKAPFAANCADCQTQTTVLKKWDFLSHSTTLGNGKHHFPFSVLLGGRHPASTNTPLVSISYVFSADAVTTAPSPEPTSASPASDATSCLTFERVLDVKRSIPEPAYPHSSVRIFPPTNIKAATNYSSVIYPNRSKPVTLKIDGLVTHNEKFGTVDLWRLKKLTWKIEETIKTVAPACKKHEAEAALCEGAESSIKGQERSETRVIGEKTLYEGWKSDYAGKDGYVDMEFDLSLNQEPAPPQRRGSHSHSKSAAAPGANANAYACDVQTSDGTVVSHSLCLELVVSKEFAQEGKTHQSHQTGTGRILRMHFGLTLTHNAGMGLSWDVEAPPLYEDVPASPPSYQWEEDPIEYDDLEMLDAAGLTAPNSRRQSRSGL